jgi:hypothetical protein
MENVTTIRVPATEAEALWRDYRDAFRRKREAFLHDMQVAYGHMKHGKAVIDVWDAFAKTGLDEKGFPRLAICRADSRLCYAHRSEWSNGTFDVAFGNDPAVGRWRRQDASEMRNGDVHVPRGTFKFPPVPQGQTQWTNLRTTTPIIPAKLIPTFNLNGYHILWEVEKWDVVTPPRDPMLLKRINANSFVVLSAWELTDLERAILRGRL